MRARQQLIAAALSFILLSHQTSGLCAGGVPHNEQRVRAGCMLLFKGVACGCRATLDSCTHLLYNKLESVNMQA